MFAGSPNTVKLENKIKIIIELIWDPENEISQSFLVTIA